MENQWVFAIFEYFPAFESPQFSLDKLHTILEFQEKIPGDLIFFLF